MDKDKQAKVLGDVGVDPKVGKLKTRLRKAGTLIWPFVQQTNYGSVMRAPGLLVHALY